LEINPVDTYLLDVLGRFQRNRLCNQKVRTYFQRLPSGGIFDSNHFFNLEEFYSLESKMVGRR
jgi:hypothetical protein